MSIHDGLVIDEDGAQHQTPKKKAGKKRPTARTLEMLRKDGITAQVVERWQVVPNHPGGGVRQDLFGCIDVIAIDGGAIVGIQCGADSGHSGHIKKCLAEPRLREWLAVHCARFEIHSWGQKGKAGAQKRWKLRIAQLVLNKSGEVVVAHDYAKAQQLDLVDLT